MTVLRIEDFDETLKPFDSLNPEDGIDFTHVELAKGSAALVDYLRNCGRDVNTWLRVRCNLQLRIDPTNVTMTFRGTMLEVGAAPTNETSAEYSDFLQYDGLQEQQLEGKASGPSYPPCIDVQSVYDLANANNPKTIILRHSFGYFVNLDADLSVSNADFAAAVLKHCEEYGFKTKASSGDGNFLYVDPAQLNFFCGNQKYPVVAKLHKLHGSEASQNFAVKNNEMMTRADTVDSLRRADFFFTSAVESDESNATQKRTSDDIAKDEYRAITAARLARMQVTAKAICEAFGAVGHTCLSHGITPNEAKDAADEVAKELHAEHGKKAFALLTEPEAAKIKLKIGELLLCTSPLVKSSATDDHVLWGVDCGTKVAVDRQDTSKEKPSKTFVTQYCAGVPN